MIRYTDEQVVSTLKKVMLIGVDEAAKELGVNPATVWMWTKKAGMKLPRRTSKRDWEVIKNLLA